MELKVVEFLRRDPVIKQVNDAKSEELGVSLYR